MFRVPRTPMVVPASPVRLHWRSRWWPAFPILALVLGLLAGGQVALAEMILRQVPDEYETTGGLGVALNNAGYAASDAVAAIRANPALLTARKQYTVSGGYHWPTVGREFYQASIVDSKTSQVAAGLSYTGYTENYAYAGENSQASPFDSPIVRRGVVGVAQNFGGIALGAGATYVEGHTLWSSPARIQDGQEKVRGFGLNVGAAYGLGPLSLGGSAENVSNRKIQDYAPQTYRAGLAYAFNQKLVGMLDFRQRARIPEFEAERRVDLDRVGGEESSLPAEQMAFASFSAQLQEYLLVLGSYGQALNDDRRAIAGGVAISGRNFSFSYTASRPYMNRTAAAHQAVSLNLDMTM